MKNEKRELRIKKALIKVIQYKDFAEYALTAEQHMQDNFTYEYYNDELKALDFSVNIYANRLNKILSILHK